VTTEEEYTQWHDDGHEMTLEVCIGASSGGRKYTSAQMKVHCPDGSFCRRWQAEHDVPVEHCFVKTEIDAVGHWDFIEMMETEGLPEDWSSTFPIRLTWRDQGEDGITWRPSESPLTRFFERKASSDVAQR
jgi:hypothetical protein